MSRSVPHSVQFSVTVIRRAAPRAVPRGFIITRNNTNNKLTDRVSNTKWPLGQGSVTLPGLARLAPSGPAGMSKAPPARQKRGGGIMGMVSSSWLVGLGEILSCPMWSYVGGSSSCGSACGFLDNVVSNLLLVRSSWFLRQSSMVEKTRFPCKKCSSRLAQAWASADRYRRREEDEAGRTARFLSYTRKV